MAERTLDFTLTYGLDESYADKERDIAWRAALLDPEVNQAAEAGPGQGTPEQVAAAGTAAEPPSAIATGAQAAFQAAGEGARSAMEGLTRTVLTRPQGGANLADEVARGLADKAGGVRQFLMEGLMQVVSAPLIGLGAGARQALKNQRPDLEGAVLTPDGGFIRMVLGGGNPLEAGEDAKALRGPMTVGEALDLAVQQAPLALGGAAKVRQAAKIQGETIKGQRGSAGPPPDLGALEAAARKATEAVDALGPEPPKPSPESRAFGTQGRAGTDPATVKAYDERVKAHSRWRRQFSKLKKLEVEASNAAFRAKRAVTREVEAEAAQFHGVELNLSDPDSIAAFVRQHGGVKPDPALAGEFARIPLDLKNTRGLPYDVIAEQGGVDGRALLDALTDMEFLRRQKRERDAAARQAEVDQWKGYEPTAEDVTLTSALDEWDRMMAAADVGGPEQQYPQAGKTVSGLEVLSDVPNEASIGASLTQYEVLPGIREVPFSLFTGPDKITPRVQKLMDEIKASGQIKPLIVVVEPAGPYILEGGHRFDALQHLGRESFPARVVIDIESPRDVNARAEAAGSRAAGEGLEPAPGAGPGPGQDPGGAGGSEAGGPVSGRGLPERVAAAPEGSPGAAAPPRGDAGGVGGSASPPPGGGGGGGGVPPSSGPGPGAPRDPNMRLNLDRVDASDRVKGVMADLNRLVGEKLLGQHRETVTHEATKAAASRYTLEQILASDPATTPVEEGRVIQHALRDYFNTTATTLEEHLRGLPEQAGETPSPEFFETFAVAVKLAALDERFGAGFARGTEARKIMSEAAASKISQAEVLALGAQLAANPHVTPATVVQGLQALTRPQRRGWLAQVWHGLRAGKDLFHEAWINALLSNPVTHVSNLTGTGLSTAWEIPERYTAEMVNRIFRQDPAGVQRGETASMLRSMIGALEDGIRLANQTWETGQASFETGQVETHQVRARDYGFDPESRFGRALDVLGASLRSKAAPTRALLTEDAFYKGINYRMELSALALREGMLEGLEGPALERRVAALEARPTPEMIAAAQDAATLRTLNKELGPAGQAFMMWANQIPGGRVVLPFIRTPTNIAKWTAQRTPALNLLSQQNWRDIQAGGAARDKAVARMALGSAVGAVLAWQVAQGTITGGGTGSRERKRLAEITGTRPAYALKIGDEWVKYGRGGDPLAGLVGVVADFVELASEIPDQEGLDEWAAHGEVLALALGQTFVNKTYMQGLSNVLEALKQPDRNTKQVALGLARSLVPAGVRQLARVSDDNIVREARTLVDAIRAGIPGLSQGIPAARNPITGDAIRTPAGWGPDMLSPALVTTNPRDPVIDEVLANKIDLAAVPWYVGGTLPDAGPQITEPRATAGLRLTPEEHDRWVTLMTEDVKDGRGRTLHGALTDLVASEKYQQQSTGPDGGRALLIKSLFQTYREQAKARLMDPTTGSPLLKRDLEATMRKRLEQRLPQTDPRSPQFNPGALLQSLGR